MAKKGEYDYSRIFQNLDELLHRLNNKKASRNDLISIKLDIVEHMKKPHGTLDNYSGKFTKEIIDAAIKYYDDIICSSHFKAQSRIKVDRLLGKLWENIMNNEKTYSKADIIKLLLKYSKGIVDDIEQQDKTTIVNNVFQLEANGQTSLPLEKL